MKADLSLTHRWIITLALENFLKNYDFDKHLKHPHDNGMLQDSFFEIEEAIHLYCYIKSLNEEDE